MMERYLESALWFLLFGPAFGDLGLFVWQGLIVGNNDYCPLPDNKGFLSRTIDLTNDPQYAHAIGFSLDDVRHLSAAAIGLRSDIADVVGALPSSDERDNTVFCAADVVRNLRKIRELRPVRDVAYYIVPPAALPTSDSHWDSVESTESQTSVEFMPATPADPSWEPPNVVYHDGSEDEQLDSDADEWKATDATG